VRRRLDYLADLGIDAGWLSPIFRSPMADFGYDVSDYQAIDPTFGTLADFDRLTAEAHARGIRVILDWVPNHTSDEHPWFVESRSSRNNPKRDWYVWRDEPNNWTATFGDYPAWTFDPHTRQYYLHHFLPQQPDLNWSNPDVVAAMHDVLRFWLDRGVDGFRADVVHLIGKDPTLPDDPPQFAGTARVGRHEHASTHDLLRGIRQVLESYGDDRMMVGEINLSGSAVIAAYYGQGDELHLAFNFDPLFAPWDAARWRELVTDIEASYDAAGAWPTWVLSNHDQPRHRTRYGSQERARAAAVLLLTLRGTPFLYAGEELGLADATVPADRVVDPGGRDGCRAPIPWSAGPSHGWATTDPWLPWPPDPDVRNAEEQAGDPTSVLQLYRRLLASRRDSAALRRGDLALLDSPPEVIAYVRSTADDERAVLVNFAAAGQRVELGGNWVVEVASDGNGHGAPFEGTVGADTAVLLRHERIRA
jgi:alpha-glucosidase